MDEGGGVGLIRSQLCVELGENVEYHDDGNVDLTFRGKVYRLPFLNDEIHRPELSILREKQ